MKKKYICSSYGNKIDEKHWFYRRCFDEFINEEDLVSLPNGVTKCKYCRGTITEIECNSKSQYRRLSHQLKRRTIEEKR